MRAVFARAQKICARHLEKLTNVSAAIGLGLALISQPTTSQAANTAKSKVVVILNDRGGLVRARANLILRMNAANQRVRIQGRICYSTCTMYLGMPQTCVNPNTIFGFHGPTYYGTRLSVADFEYWSNIIAKHYPEPLRSWYMRVGRTETPRLHRMSGRQLIKIGIRQC